jgi:NAD(P)-dependent dehydrogenase (short-subunit alcohol dehydrogenase family)
MAEARQPMKRSAKVVVLTGVSRGLGLAMTEEFIGRGHIVIGCARSSDVLKKLQQRHPKPNSFQQVDVAIEAEVKRWAEAVIKQHGPPDLLINNAAVINPNAPLWQIDGGEFSRVIDVNVKGVANQIRHFVPAMIKRGRGVIVNVSSGWGRSVDAEVAPYCATKFAIEGLTRALALELPAGLAAVALNPGIIDTAMLQSCFGGSASGYEAPDQWAQRAVPFILKLSRSDNGSSPTVPGSRQ